MIRRLVLLLAAASLLAGLAASPASADPPAEFDVENFVVFGDGDNRVAVFWNIARDDFCDWVSDDPENTPPPVGELVPVSFHATGKDKDAFVSRWKATRDLELWAFDDDVPPGDTGLDFDVCAATDEQDGPWAEGSAQTNNNDNDTFVSGTRTNAFGGGGQGTVVTTNNGGDTYRYSWKGLFQLGQDAEPFDPATLRAGVGNLHKIGN